MLSCIYFRCASSPFLSYARPAPKCYFVDVPTPFRGKLYSMPLPRCLPTQNPKQPLISTAPQRKSRADGEALLLELQHAQSRLIKAKKDAYRLEKALAKSTANNQAEVQAGDRRGAHLSPSPEAILGDWVAEERPRKDGGERTWALSRKSSSGSSGGKREASTITRSTSAPVGGRSAGGAAATIYNGRGPRPGELGSGSYTFSVFECLSIPGRSLGEALEVRWRFLHPW